MSKIDHEKINKVNRGKDGKSAYDELPPVGSFRDQARWWREHNARNERRAKNNSEKRTFGIPKVKRVHPKLGNLDGFITAIEMRSFKKKEPEHIEAILKSVSDRLVKLQQDPEFDEIQIDSVYLRACEVLAGAYEYLEKWVKRGRAT